jgi:cytochrome c553
MQQVRSQTNPRSKTSAPNPGPATLTLKALPLLLLGCPALISAAPELTEVEMVAVMEQHYHSAISAHDALIRDDLEGLRQQLAKLVEQSLPPAAPQSWQTYDAELREAARTAAEANDLGSAASTMAAVAEACGICHAALGVEKIYFWPAPPEGDETIKATMQTHQWATERLWEGVTGPWDNAWERGSAALAESRVFREGEAVTDSLRAREIALRGLGQMAKTINGLQERASLYGQLLTSCTGCHQEAGVTIKQAPPPPWQQ